MATRLTSKIEEGEIKIPGNVVKFWRGYICTFNQKPTQEDKREKRGKMKLFINAELLTTPPRKKWKLAKRISWRKDCTDPLVYHVKIFIKKRIPGEPGGSDRTPTPPPPSPPPM